MKNILVVCTVRETIQFSFSEMNLPNFVKMLTFHTKYLKMNSQCPKDGVPNGNENFKSDTFKGF